MAKGEFALARQVLGQTLQKANAGAVDALNNGSWAGDQDLYAMLADTATRESDQALLRQYAPLAEELAIRYGHPLYQAIAHRAWGVAHRLAGEYPAAETRLQQALDLFGQLGTRWQSGRTLAEAGELARVRADPMRARDCFSRALFIFEELHALPDVARMRAALESLDRDGQPQGEGAARPTAPYPADLTEREVEVLRLLARGFSNAEIAEQLVVSPRTVGAHLRSIFGKLDVTTRTAAARAAIDLRLV